MVVEDKSGRILYVVVEPANNAAKGELVACVETGNKKSRECSRQARLASIAILSFVHVGAEVE